MDQNETLSVFGVTCVIDRDGFSGMIVASAVMQKKNNIIYEQVYRSAVLNNGLLDQVRVDHGREFYLTLFMHERLRENIENSEIPQTTSTQNHIIECIWVKLNRRVPIRRAIVDIQETATINMNCPVTMFDISNM